MYTEIIKPFWRGGPDLNPHTVPLLGRMNTGLFSGGIGLASRDYSKLSGQESRYNGMGTSMPLEKSAGALEALIGAMAILTT